MSKYIGATVVNLSVDTVDVTGDITATDSTPELILLNDTHEDTDGGREGKVTFKGEQSGGEVTVLAQIQSSHDGTSDDQKGDLIFKTNDGSDGTSPTERMRIDSVGTVTITNASNDSQLILESTDADADSGPVLELYRNSSSPADDDLVGAIEFHGENDADEKIQYGLIAAKLQDASDSTEDVRLSFKTITAGTERERVTIQPTEVVINEDSQDLDFRVESDGDANAFFVQASDSKVGINTSSPLSTFQVRDTGSDGGTIRVGGSSAALGLELLYDQSGATVTYIQSNPTYTNTSSLMHIRVDGDANPDQLVLKGDGSVGIGTQAPLRQLSISNSGNTEMSFISGTSGLASILFGDGLTGTDVYRGYIQYQHNNDALLLGTAATTRMQIGSSGSLNVVGVYNDTTSSSANVNVASDGHLRRSTSSRRYKNTITDATHGLTELLTLRPVTYKGNEDGDTIFGGLIAEEVHESGLTEFVLYDDDNEPDSLAYSNMVSLCIKAIQELSAKVETLETKVAALEAE